MLVLFEIIKNFADKWLKFEPIHCGGFSTQLCHITCHDH